MTRRDLIKVARGNKPADLLLTNARIVNVFTAEIERGNVAIYNGRIAGIGDYWAGEKVIDLKGQYIVPSFIDGHVHPESSLLHIARYAQVVVPHGIGAIVTDFHEIANVKGLKGIEYMLRCAQPLPLDVYLMVPSCVPATNLETSGACLKASDIREALSWENTIGLGEMMNYPGVLASEEDVLSKMLIASGKLIDGHAPGLYGKELNAYIASGISSDHECTNIEEAKDKLKCGMYIMIREGSSEKNLEALMPVVTDDTYKRCLFVVDDRNCIDLIRLGDVDAVVRKAIRLGMDPIRAIQLATINPADYFGLRGLGAIAPGYYANLFVTGDLSSLQANMVFYRGEQVAEEGKPLFATPILINDEANTINIGNLNLESLRMSASDGLSHVIEIIPDQIVTRKLQERVKSENGFVVPDIEKDILKLVVVERHKATGNIGLGLVRGFGLKSGALGSSFAHDSHNIIVVGTNDRDIFHTIKEIERLHGGLVIVANGHVLYSLPLPIAGQLSTEHPDLVAMRLEKLHELASLLGCSLRNPFATLSMLALPVIPELRLTDLGLVDVQSQLFIDECGFSYPGTETDSIKTEQAHEVLTGKQK
jgi:adenine deaminase